MSESIPHVVSEIRAKRVETAAQAQEAERKLAKLRAALANSVAAAVLLIPGHPVPPAGDTELNWSHTDEHSAFYQAGAAVVATLLGLEVEAISINLDDTYTSWICIGKPEYGEMNCRVDRLAKFSVLKALLAGPAAKMLYSFGGVSTGFDPSDPYLVHEPAIPRALDLAAELPRDQRAILRRSGMYLVSNSLNRKSGRRSRPLRALS